MKDIIEKAKAVEEESKNIKTDEEVAKLPENDADKVDKIKE